MGQAPPGSSYNQSGEGYPLISGAGDFGDAYPAPKKFTTEATRISRIGDLVLGIRASIGAKVLADGEYCLGRGVAALRAKDNIDERYLWHHITSSTRELVSKARGATFKQVNRADISDLLITLPPIEEQRRIAAILDKADELRTKRREAIAKLDTLAQSIFIDMFGDPAKNPLDWSEVALGDITELLSGFAFKSAQFGDEIGLPVVRIRDVKRGYSETYFDGEYDPKYIIDDGDLLIGMDGEFNRETWSGGQALLNQRVCKLEADQNSLDQRYLHHFLPQALKEIERGTSFATVKHISAKQIRAIRIPLPPLETQLKFASLVKLVEQDTSRYKEQISRLNTLFSSLQQRAFKGEL
jgi:type I restriction enzyme, S subunit